MTAAVPLIHAVTVAMVAGIMVEQLGVSEGSVAREMWEKGVEMEWRRPRISGEGECYRESIQEIALQMMPAVYDTFF